MTDPIRSALKRLLSAVLDGLGQDDHPMGWARVDDAIDAARAALAEPVGEGVTDEELLELAQHHSVSYTLSDGSVVYPLQEGCDMRDDVLSFARAVLARWGHHPAPPAAGEVGELVAWLRLTGEGQPRLSSEGYARLTRAAALLEHLAGWKESALAVEREWDAHGIATMLGCKLGESQRACIQREVPRLLDQLRELEQCHPVPVPVAERLPWHVEQALIKAECALSDIAEGEPEENEGDSDALLLWAEQRAAAVLARIRPVMREHGIRTSEWPPLPATALPLPQGEVE